jgi:hypothetical protein
MPVRILNVAEGADLVEALRASQARWLSGVGTVQGVELRVAGEAADPIRALRGRLTLVSLMGPGDGPWGVVLSRATDSGLELLGGELVRATSLGVTLSVQDALAATATTGARAAATAAAPAPVAVEDSPTRAAATGWAAVANASARALRAASLDVDDQQMPEPGDLVRHFAFGLCEVIMSDHDRLKIRDLEGPGRIREIRTDKLSVRGPTDEDGKRLFQLERKS